MMLVLPLEQLLEAVSDWEQKSTQILEFLISFLVQSNATISSNKNRDFYLTKDGITTPKSLGNTDLSFSPDVILGNMFTYRPVENLQFSFLSKYVGKQFMSNFSSNISSNDVLDSYITSDLNFVYELRQNKIFKAIVFTALINNIFNKHM